MRFSVSNHDKQKTLTPIKKIIKKKQTKRGIKSGKRRNNYTERQTKHDFLGKNQVIFINQVNAKRFCKNRKVYYIVYYILCNDTRLLFILYRICGFLCLMINLRFLSSLFLYFLRFRAHSFPRYVRLIKAGRSVFAVGLT